MATLRRGVVVVAFWLSLVSAATAQTFHSGTELVHVNVTVQGADAKYVSGLQATQFTVLEDGVPQAVQFFAGGDLPLDFVILLDTSESMTEPLKLVQEAAIRFAQTARPGDRASVMTIASGLRILQPLTSDLPSIERAIRSTRAGGQTPLYSALYVALTELAREARSQTSARRQAIIVLSDGQDTASTFPFDALLEAARRQGVPIFPVAPRPTEQVQLKREKFYGESTRESDFELRTLAAETGGRAFFPVLLSDLKNVYADIADELAHQYSIGYQSSNPSRNGAYRRINVRVEAGQGLKWRARAGYLTDGVTASASSGRSQ